MSDHVPLTDEELAAMAKRAAVGAMLAASSWGREFSDAVPRLIADLRASRAEVERLREALDFYADPENWQAKFVAIHPGGAQEWQSGPANDGGDRVRRALNVPLP